MSVSTWPRMAACFLMQFKTVRVAEVPESKANKVAVITGGNSGIGYETALSLAKQGCLVYILCRNVIKAKEVQVKINETCKELKSSGLCELLTLDLSDLNSVKICANELRSILNGRNVDYFVCNGGIMNHPYEKSQQGYEIHFATNHLGHFALVGCMIDILTTSQSRVVVIAGDIAVMADDASHDFTYSDNGLMAYCRSKICNQSFALQLHDKYAATTGLKVYSVHPGVINSHLVAPAEGWLGAIETAVRPWVMIDCNLGAQSTLLCLSANDATVPPGSYYHNVFGVTKHHQTALKPGWGENMWELSVKLCNDAAVPLRF